MTTQTHFAVQFGLSYSILDYQEDVEQCQRDELYEEERIPRRDRPEVEKE